MALQNFKMFMVVGTGSINQGKVSLTMLKPDNSDQSFAELCGTRVIKEVECEFDVPDLDLRQIEVEALESQVQNIRASAQVKVNYLLDRISKLKCLTHEVQS